MLLHFDSDIRRLSLQDATILKREQSIKFFMGELKSRFYVSLKLEESFHKHYTSRRFD